MLVGKMTYVGYLVVSHRGDPCSFVNQILMSSFLVQAK